MKKQKFFPVLSSSAGQCLTHNDWQNSGIETGVYYLRDLLVKPGLPLLGSLLSLKHFIGWPGAIVLNATFENVQKNGEYTIRSAIDGAKISINKQQLFELVISLKPNKVILPVGSGQDYLSLWQHLPSTIIPYFEKGELMSNPVQRYWHYKGQDNFPEFISQLSQQVEPIYIMGDFNYQQLRQLQRHPSHCVESDLPAALGMQGIGYDKNQLLNLLEPTFSQEFVAISADCTCQTCQQQLTRAYLHHLIQHTPLLAYRLLVAHNVFLCS